MEMNVDLLYYTHPYNAGKKEEILPRHCFSLQVMNEYNVTIYFDYAWSNRAGRNILSLLLHKSSENVKNLLTL